MSFWTTIAAWEVEVEAGGGVSRPAKKLVLLALADEARKDGSGIRISVAQLVDMTKLQRRAVQKALRCLEADGLIKFDRPATPRRPAEYRLGVWYAGAPAKAAGGVDTTPQRRRQDAPRGVERTPSPVSRLLPPVVASDEPVNPRGADHAAAARRAIAAKLPASKAAASEGRIAKLRAHRA